MWTSAECYDERTFLIYIDSYENGVPTGHFCNPLHEEADGFMSLTQLLLKLDASLDVEDMPQSFQKVRTFYPSEAIWSAPCAASGGKGKLATFVVHVYYWRNASWQGSVTWLDEKRTQRFRSVLELISLMDSALMEKSGMDVWPLKEKMTASVM